MAQLFHRSANTISKVSIFGAVFIIAFGMWAWARLDRSSYNTGEGVVLMQPVPFSHDHHTAALGIDCRYCHTSVETAAFAGIPPTATCMNCHKEIWKDSEMLRPVRESWASGEPIRWERVHDLPDYVYFDHSIHVAKGMGCDECHGRVDRMPLIYQATSLQMEWCLDCHRQPEKNVRPLDQVVNMAWQPPDDGGEQRRQLAEELELASEMSCNACHR